MTPAAPNGAPGGTPLRDVVLMLGVLVALFVVAAVRHAWAST